MKPRTVLLTLELRDCVEPLHRLTATRFADLSTTSELGYLRTIGGVEVAHATAAVEPRTATRRGRR